MPRAHLLEIPGGQEIEGSELSNCANELERLIKFRPGGKCYSTAPSGVIRIPDQRWDLHYSIRYVGSKNLQELKDILRNHDVAFEEPSYALCCEASSQQSKVIRFLNYWNEPIVCFSSGTQLSTVRGRAYVDKFNLEDELLEREIITDWKQAEKDDETGQSYCALTIYPSPTAAQEAIDNEVMAALRNAAESNSFGKTYVGAFIRNSKYRYPVTLTDDNIKTRDVVMLGMSIPGIVRVYADGAAVVDVSGYTVAPLFNYFSQKEGILTDSLVACEHCHVKARANILERAMDEIFTGDLAGETARRIGYRFDPARIRVRLFPKKPIAPL